MQITLEYVRPSVDVLWPHEIMPAEARQYLHDTYIAPGYITNEIIDVSEDNLTVKWIFQWIDAPALIPAWTRDQTINNWRAYRDNYAATNGIIKKPTVVSYFDKELEEQIEFVWQD